MNLRALKPHFPRNGIEVGLLRRERAAEVQTIACHRQCLQRLAAAESPAACAPIARAKVLPAHGLPHNRAAQTMRVRKPEEADIACHHSRRGQLRGCGCTCVTRVVVYDCRVTVCATHRVFSEHTVHAPVQKCFAHEAQIALQTHAPAQMTSQSCARTNAIRPAFVSHMAREFTMYATGVQGRRGR